MQRTIKYILVFTLLALVAGLLLQAALRASGLLLVAGGAINAAQVYDPVADSSIIIPV